MLTYEQYFGDGWLDLVNDTLEKIELIDPHYRVDQIKTKFGSLRIYGESSYEYGTPNAMLIGTIINEAEMRSETICERCGLPGEYLVFRGSFSTACDKHKREGAEPVLDD